MTLKYILKFAIKHDACNAQLNKFKKFIQSGDELQAWQTVQGNLNWLKGEYKLRISYKEVYDKSGGIGKTWYDNGQLCLQCTYNENGIREGLSQNWHPNGQLREQITFNEKGEKEGSYQQWYDNGQLASVMQYSNGVLHGHYTSFKFDGSPLNSWFYENGKKI